MAAKKNEVTKVEAVKVEFGEFVLKAFLNYVLKNKDNFEIDISITEIKIECINSSINYDLMQMFNSAMTPWDLVYFKNVIFNKNNKTIDFTFDSHSRCQPDVSAKVIPHVFGLFC